MSNKYFDYYKDDNGFVDSELSLDSNGFREITDCLEVLFDKLGKGRHHDMSLNYFDNIRLDLVEHFTQVANSTTEEEV